MVEARVVSLGSNFPTAISRSYTAFSIRLWALSKTTSPQLLHQAVKEDVWSLEQSHWLRRSCFARSDCPPAYVIKVRTFPKPHERISYDLGCALETILPPKQDGAYIQLKYLIQAQPRLHLQHLLSQDMEEIKGSVLRTPSVGSGLRHTIILERVS